MTRITALNSEQAPESSRRHLEGLHKAFGVVPNVFATMAHSPAALGGYLALSQALQKSTLTSREREAVALAVSQVNGCDYCLAAHVLFAGKAGLDASDITRAREGRLDAVVVLARQVVELRGRVTERDLHDAREAGLSDAKIVDVIALVATTTFTNYLNNVANTELDFPAVD
ncbi:carboxymuconolactone decarboxylase family protein [Pseudomonas sp. NUPR-001]|uniref:carboxymuconolactone decarboxylase family protein n=1 Tax=Pseudomonas sp. NUPR-001 TaxID=3416058 RepID=UPI003F991226